MDPIISFGNSDSQGDDGAVGALLKVSELKVQFETSEGLVVAPKGVTFAVSPGEILGIVGESGSGKSTTARSLVGLVPKPGVIAGGEIWFNGRNLIGLEEKEFNHIRGREIGYIFQDSRAALNPLLTVGYQIRETLRSISSGMDVLALLEEVGIPDAARRQYDFPHQFSGGMCQRVMIAIAVANRPALLIADEPTSALDVTTQAQILELLRSLARSRGMAMILITHDMGIVSELCDRVIVMYGGMVMEEAPTPQLMASPQHPYTKALLSCSPRLQAWNPRGLQPIEGNSPSLVAPPPGCVFHPRCSYAVEKCKVISPPFERIARGRRSACWLSVDKMPLEAALRTNTVPGYLPAPTTTDSPPSITERSPPRQLLQLIDVEKHFSIAGRSRLPGLQGQLQLRAVDGVSLTIDTGETLALVGESGSGKSTVGRLIARVYRPTAGAVLFEGVDIGSISARRMRGLRRRIQMILQDPYSSLNPRMTVEEAVSEPLQVHRAAIEDGGRATRRAKIRRLVVEALAAVNLDSDSISRYPHQFSGGQRQRISIARALVLRPSLVIADEPVSSLDVSAQAQIVALLKSLQKNLRLTYLFIAHDLALVRHLADRVAVMYLGKIVECGPVSKVFGQPLHPYTTALLSAAGSGDSTKSTTGRIVLRGEIPSALNPPSGCRFRTRCPVAQAICADVVPLDSVDECGHVVACHFPGKLTGHAMSTPLPELAH